MKILLQNPPKRTKKKAKKKARRKTSQKARPRTNTAPAPRRRRRRRAAVRTNPPSRTSTVAKKKKARRSGGRRSGGRLGFIDRQTLMQIAGVTIGAVVPPLLVSRFAPGMAKTPMGAAGANVAAGAALALAAEKMGQRDIAKAIIVGAGASGLTVFVSNALAKAPGVKGFLTEEQVENWPRLEVG